MFDIAVKSKLDPPPPTNRNSAATSSKSKLNHHHYKHRQPNSHHHASLSLQDRSPSMDVASYVEVHDLTFEVARLGFEVIRLRLAASIRSSSASADKFTILQGLYGIEKRDLMVIRSNPTWNGRKLRGACIVKVSQTILVILITN